MMNPNIYNIIFILGFWRLLQVCVNTEMVFKTTNIVCTGNPKYVENVICSVKARNWNNAVAYMDCDLVLPLQNTTFHLEVFKKGYNNRYHPFLVNVMIKMCDVM
ncbi:uncharacterized protein LOC127565382 [Drosophila albomicans]|uniref:Uncharacterized protein LOC127565382 n=1 Tax=Drosophila albomicans TaxID=7291 RepID=A0A9C6SP45_DROAB|nr:uncharacterized protein LOC127565382 [Drosophila albomicans]